MKDAHLRHLFFMILMLVLLTVAIAAAMFNGSFMIENPFRRSLLLEYPSLMITDADSHCYVIDKSMRRIIKFSTTGDIIYIIQGGSREPGHFLYAYDITVDRAGRLYVLNGVLDEPGFFMKREEILRFTADGRFDKVIFSRTYCDQERKPEHVQRGEIISLSADNNYIWWASLDHEQIRFFRSIIDRDIIENWKTLHVKDANLLIANTARSGEDVCYVSKKGTIVQNSAHGNRIVYNASSESSLSTPWDIVYSGGKIWFSDLETRTVKCFSPFGDSPAPRDVLSKDIITQAGHVAGNFIFYRIDMNPHGILTACNDYYVMAITQEGRFVTYLDRVNYPPGMLIYRLFIWLLIISSISLSIYIIWFVFNKIMNRRVSLMIKQITLVVPLIVIAIAFTSTSTISEYSAQYYKNMQNRISQVIQLIRGTIDPELVKRLQSHGDYMNSDYIKLRENLLASLNYNRDEWNDNIYFVLYKIKNDKLYGIMYLNGEICINYPYLYFENPLSDYRKAYDGAIVTNISSDSWGTWLYGVGPVYGKDGKIEALIEVGADYYSFTQQKKGMIRRTVTSTLIILTFSILLVMGVTYFILISILKLRNAVTLLAQGEWDTHVIVRNHNDEVADLSEGFNKMSKYILNYINEITQLNRVYRRFVPEQFIDYLGKGHVTEIQLGDQVQKEMTVMFTDIRSFTAISEKMTPEDNFNFLNNYLKTVGPAIRMYRGFIDKYIGDSIMALFPHSPDDSLQSAIEIFYRLYNFNDEIQKNGGKPIRVGVGIHTGSLMLGILGEEERMDGTVISDNVNLASRMEGLTKHMGAYIIISEVTRRALRKPNLYLTRYLGSVTVKGRHDSMGMYEILDPLPTNEKMMKLRTRDLFEYGVRLYSERNISDALDVFYRIASFDGMEAATSLYISICEGDDWKEIPEDRWDGSIIMNDK